MEGRYLLGVEPVDAALTFLAQNSPTEIDPAAFAASDAQARRRRASRTYTPARVRPLAPEAAEHLRRLADRSLFRSMFEGTDYEVASVDIAGLVVAQPHVNFGYALRRVPEPVTPPQALEICLPVTKGNVDAWGGVNSGPNVACTLVTPDLNLTVTEARLDTSDGIRPVFVIGRTAVFCHVVAVDGRLVIKNGTHRAVGLCARGIVRMPCLVTRADTPADLPEGIDRRALMGDHPPTVADFLDPELHLVHTWPERIKVIRIIADEYVAPRMP